MVERSQLIPGLNEFDMANNHNIRVRAYVDEKVGDSYKVHIDSWADSIFYRSVSVVQVRSSTLSRCICPDGRTSAGVSLLEVCARDRDIQAGTWAAAAVAQPQPQQEFQGRVIFKREYAAPPTVIVWLTGFDFEKGRNFRIRAQARDVTATGFTVVVGTWSDTLLYWASVSWIAYSSDSPRVKSGSYNTADVRPWQKPQLVDTGEAKFSGSPFAWPPTVIVAVNTFDIDAKGTSIRWKATVSEITSEGFRWNLDSWYDTIKYSMGASYLALDNGPPAWD